MPELWDKVVNLWDSISAIPDGAQALTDWVGDGGIVVDSEESQRRANICLHCPENGEDWIVTGLIADAARKMLEVKNKLKLRVIGERSLGRCKVCTCVLRLEVHQPIELVKKHMKLNGDIFPGHCWKNQ